MKTTDTTLDKIVAAKRLRLAARQAELPMAALERRLADMPGYNGPGFFEVLKAPTPRPKLIAEAKPASPSQGLLRQNFLPAEINQAYQAAPNVVAISVITESDYFKGNDQTLEFFAAHNTHQKPLLRKDFIFEPYQMYESKLLGAQACLLLTSLLDEAELNALVDLGLKIGVEPLVEAHDQAELALALTTQARVIGVNSRDLKTFKIDNQLHSLLRQVGPERAKVAESGIDSADYLAELADFADAALVGGYLMSAKDIGQAIDGLVDTKGAAQ